VLIIEDMIQDFKMNIEICFQTEKIEEGFILGVLNEKAQESKGEVSEDVEMKNNEEKKKVIQQDDDDDLEIMEASTNCIV
jgi:hypothetical protein